MHSASSKLTMTHTFRKFFLSYSTSVATPPLGVHAFLLSFWNTSVSIQKVSGKVLNARVKSDYVSRCNMIKLQFDFECLCLRRPRERSPSTERLTVEGLEAFPLCHFYLSVERFPFDIYEICCRVHNAWIFFFLSFFFLSSVVWLQ